MKDAVSKMVPLAMKLVKRRKKLVLQLKKVTLKEELERTYLEKISVVRGAVNMMIKKLKGEEFETEFPMPHFDRVDPNPAVKDITKLRLLW